MIILKDGYLEYEEDENKGYIDTTNQIIEYKVNSNRINKIIPKSDLDENQYELNNSIIRKNNKLYIALEDLNVGCNLVYQFSKDNNQILINTPENLITQYSQNSTDLKIDNNYSNQTAALYNMLIVTDNNGNNGVIDLEGNSLIGYKYSSMEFDEYSQRYIVSDGTKYGLISKEGKEIVEMKYESIEIINYVPLLYKVKINNKYGVINETGKIAIRIEYDAIGFSEKSNLIEPALIIKNLKNKQNGIVVAINNKYGIASLETGKMIIECELDKIYSKTSDSEKEYYIKLGDAELKLNEYLDYINTTIITN